MKKRKRVKTKTKPAVPTPTTKFEQCWYCELNADAGAEAIILLTKRDDDFQYFVSDSEEEEEKLITTQVKIPRCIECQAAHDKVENPVTALTFYTIISFALIGVYFGVFEKRLPWFIYLIIGLGVSGAVIAVAIAASRNFLTLPEKIKDLRDVADQSEVKALLSKDWKIKR